MIYFREKDLDLTDQKFLLIGIQINFEINVLVLETNWNENYDILDIKYSKFSNVSFYQ